MIAGALLGALGVALGAVGAHGLPEWVGGEGRSWWDTAVQYHLIHALALLVAGVALSGRAAAAAGGCFAVGILLFSGSLYVLALGGPRVAGLVAPFGGLALIGGWLVLAVAVWRAGGHARGR